MPAGAWWVLSNTLGTKPGNCHLETFHSAITSPSTSCGPSDCQEETASVGSHAQPGCPVKLAITFHFALSLLQTACLISEWVPLVPQPSWGILKGYKPISVPKQARHTYHCQDGRGNSGRSLPAPPSSHMQASDCRHLPPSETTSLNSKYFSSCAQRRLKV